MIQRQTILQLRKELHQIQCDIRSGNIFDNTCPRIFSLHDRGRLSYARFKQQVAIPGIGQLPRNRRIRYFGRSGIFIKKDSQNPQLRI